MIRNSVIYDSIYNSFSLASGFLLAYKNGCLLDFHHTIQYSANIDTWIKDLNVEYGAVVKSVCCGNKLSERGM